MPGWRRHFVERAIDPIADFEFQLEGLEMNIRGPILNGLVKDEVHVANDGSGIRLSLEVFQIEAAPFVEQLHLATELGEDFIHTPDVRPVILLDEFIDLMDRGDDGLDLFPQGEAQRLGRFRVERVGERHLEIPGIDANRGKRGASKPAPLG